jgi:translation initiation factor 1
MNKINLFDMGAKLDGDSIVEIPDTLLPSKHELVFLYEKRNGKPVTVVKPFLLNTKELKETHRKVKKRLGVGGTIQGDRLEFQGDIKDKVQCELEKLGFRFRKKR